MREYFTRLLIRTPFEKPVKRMQFILNLRQRLKQPELHEIYMEPLRIEQVMQRVIGISSNCIDIGCYLGSVLSEIIQFSPYGSHMAFEPIPGKARWLKQRFPEVDIREIALSDTSGEATFYINMSCSGFSGLRPHNFKQNDSFNKITVQCEKLDNILIPNYRVDFIKLDVEGAELAVLSGAADILARHHPILLFECSHSGLSLFGFTSYQVFEFLTKQHSYSIFLLKDFLDNEEALTFEQFNNALQYPFQAFNFLAIVNRL